MFAFDSPCTSRAARLCIAVGALTVVTAGSAFGQSTSSHGDSAAAATAPASAPAASSATTVGATELAPVEVRGHYLNAIGDADAASAGTVTQALIKNRPTLRPALAFPARQVIRSFWPQLSRLCVLHGSMGRRLSQPAVLQTSFTGHALAWISSFVPMTLSVSRPARNSR